MDAGDARAQRIAKASGVLAGLLLLAAMLVTSAFGPAPVETTASAREIAVLSSPLGWLLDRSIRMRIAAVAFSIWGVVAYLRCTDRRARWILAAIAALLVAWMIAMIIKWKTVSGALAIILWYAYYIPMSLIPVACAFLGAHVAGLDRTRRQRRMLAAALAVSLAFIVLVLTNDYHRWFFTFDTPTAGMLGEYSYGPAYRVFLVWSAVCYAAFFCCMGYAARRRLRLLLAPLWAFAFSAFHMPSPTCFVLSPSCISISHSPTRSSSCVRWSFRSIWACCRQRSRFRRSSMRCRSSFPLSIMPAGCFAPRRRHAPSRRSRAPLRRGPMARRAAMPSQFHGLTRQTPAFRCKPGPFWVDGRSLRRISRASMMSVPNSKSGRTNFRDKRLCSSMTARSQSLRAGLRRNAVWPMKWNGRSRPRSTRFPESSMV